MNRKKIEQILMVVGPILLFILVLLVVLSFNKDSENVFIDDKPPVDQNVDYFENISDMSEEEIRELVEQKRLVLQNFFKELKYYSISEVVDGYSASDDSNYIVIGESFLDTLKNILSFDTYSYYWNQLKEVAPKANVLINERIYMGNRDLFVDLFTNSAIATEGVNVESLSLVSANNEIIESIVDIKYCEENIYDVCQRFDRYSFILIFEENAWKVSEFTKQVN